MFRYISNIPTEVLDLDKKELEIGLVLGQGSFSAAIRLYDPYIPTEIKEKGDTPILILTMEKEKYLIQKNLFGEESVALFSLEKKYKEVKESWLDENGFIDENEALEAGEEFNYYNEVNEFDILPLLENLQEIGVNFFFMKECNSVFSLETDIISDLFCEFGEICNTPEFFEDFSTGYTENDIRERVEYLRVPIEQDDSKENLSKRVYELLLQTEDDIKQVSKIMKDSEKKLGLDIHSKQFLSVNGKTRCSDPFVFV